MKSSGDCLIFKNSYSFNNLTKWADELNAAANSFKNQNGIWPNLMQASGLTYRKIELVANTHPERIKGDGSDGMPISPEGFAELSGFQGPEYSLEMCIDESITELSFRLIFDSDPDGEFEVEPINFNKAI